MRMTTDGSVSGLHERLLGRISREPVAHVTARHETLALVDSESALHFSDCSSYRGVLSPLADDELPEEARKCRSRVTSLKHADHLETGDVVALSPSGPIRTLYRANGTHNFLFATDRCNSNCLMCSQPPKDKDDSYLINENLELIQLISDPPQHLVITGGEPTLLGEGLLRIVERLRDRLPDTGVLMLSNGRRFSKLGVAQSLASVGHPQFRVAVPVYADDPQLHDYVVQARGAFDQTVLGLHNLARCGVSVEIRVVLHALTVPRLLELSEFLYRNFPFADHIALMGLEIMGYTKRNLNELWIDPTDYQRELKAAVSHLSLRGMSVSIYNHQLCVLDRELWNFARKSISDWKNVFLEACSACSARERCGGFFASATTKHSAHIAPIP